MIALLLLACAPRTIGPESYIDTGKCTQVHELERTRVRNVDGVLVTTLDAVVRCAPSRGMVWTVRCWDNGHSRPACEVIGVQDVESR